MSSSSGIDIPLFLMGLAGLFLLNWPVVTFLHELGHAVIARVVGASTVEMYVGSYGEQAGSWRMMLPGKITLWVKLGIWPLRGGLCQLQWPVGRPPGFARQAACLLAGPLTSVAVAATLLTLAFRFEAHGALKLWLVVFGLAAVVDLVSNLLPVRYQVQLATGDFLYSDGYQLYRLAARTWAASKTVKIDDQAVLRTANELFQAGDYQASAGLFKEVLGRHINGKSIYHFAFSAYFLGHQFEEALALADKYPALAATVDGHATTRAYLLCRTERLDQAIDFYTQLLAEQPVDQHPLLRSNRGYSFLLAGRYEEALADFAVVIAQDPDNAYAHAQRGRIRLAQGDADGLADLHRARELNPKEPYAFCNLGLHAHAQGRYHEALAYLEQAAALDPDLHRLPDYLAAARACLGDEVLLG